LSMVKKDKTSTGVAGVIFALGGILAFIALAINKQILFMILSGVVAILGVYLISRAVSD